MYYVHTEDNLVVEPWNTVLHRTIVLIIATGTSTAYTELSYNPLVYMDVAGKRFRAL